MEPAPTYAVHELRLEIPARRKGNIPPSPPELPAGPCFERVEEVEVLTPKLDEEGLVRELEDVDVGGEEEEEEIVPQVSDEDRVKRERERERALEVERKLGSVEKRIRKLAMCGGADFCGMVEELGDLYGERRCGNRMDNVERALMSFAIVARRRNEQRVWAKVAKMWYERVCIGVREGLKIDVERDLRRGMKAAEKAGEEGMIWKGFLSERLFELGEKEYVGICIESMERAVKKVDGVLKAKGVVCLARAYSHVGGGGKAVKLLKSVEGILEGIDDDEGKEIREEVERCVSALEGGRAVESRCSIC